MALTEQLLLHPGIDDVYTPFAQPPNAEITDEERFRIVRERNTPSYIKTITDPNYEYNIVWQPVQVGSENTGLVQTTWPKQPWGVLSPMVVVSPAEVLGPEAFIPTDGEGIMPVQFVHTKDYDNSVRLAFASHTLAAMHALDSVRLPGEYAPSGMPSVVAMENAVNVLGYGRTLATEHLQIKKTGIRSGVVQIVGEEPTPDVNARFVTAVADGMRDHLRGEGDPALGQQLEVVARQRVRPLGYDIGMPLDRRMPLDEQADIYARVTAAHFHVGGALVQDELHTPTGAIAPSVRDQLLPPYSYRQYTYFSPETGKAHLVYGLAKQKGGAVEDAGVYLRRGPQYRQAYPAAVLEQSKHLFAARLQNALGNSDVRRAS